MTQGTEVRDAIAAANESFMAAFNGGDAAAVAALYTDDAQLLPPNSDFLVGKPAIQAFWQAGMDMGLSSAQMDIVEVDDLGDTVVEMSKYVLRGAEGQMLDQGKYIVVWKKVDGQWRLHRDIFNSSMPAPE